MDIDVFPSSELPVVFRVLRSALRTHGTLSSRERLFLDTYAKIVGRELPAADPLPIDIDDVFIEGAHQRKRLVQLSALAVLLNRPLRDDSVEYLMALAERLATSDPVLGAIDALHRGRHLRVRMLTMRRGMPAMLRDAHAAEGWRGMLRFGAAMLFKAAVNTDRLADYKRLGLLPEGTLGREYWKHMTQAGFNFPGEPAGIPQSVSYHDVAHVLAEHELTPQGEIQQGSFQGGNRRDGGFFFIQFVILHFHHGVRITPATPPQLDCYDPQMVLWAIHRGANCKVDMTHRWNYWPLMALPLHEARARCGLLPKLGATPGIRRVA